MSLYTRIIDIQNLCRAWNHVKKNKPACGIDNVTWDMYDRNHKMEIKQLNTELLNEEYECMPVKIVTLYKNNKARNIALYCMKDKVIQQSVANELSKIYEAFFPECSYAYRPDKSALMAIDNIENAVKSGVYQSVLKVDIHHFFDCINHNILSNLLKKKIREEDVIDLIMKSCTVQNIDDDGQLHDKNVGIYQGTSIAPVLSNIYLMDFDKKMLEKDIFYVRYSDDMIILAKDKKDINRILDEIIVELEIKCLEINENKTIISEIKDGFDFLGYRFDNTGKSIPAKAEENLNSRLEIMWMTEKNLKLSDKLSKGAEILGGWEQYFRNKEKITSIYEFAVIVYMGNCRKFDIYSLKEERYSLDNDNIDICKYLSEKWEDNCNYDMVLYEYENYYHLSDKDMDVNIDDAYQKELILEYKQYMNDFQRENLENIMQIYSDIECYNKASFMLDMIKEYERNAENRKKPVIQLESDESGIIKKVHFSKEQIKCYMEHFVGREDAYVVESLGRGGKRQCENTLEPLTEDVVKRHISGEITVGTFVLRNNDTAKFLVIDIDISKKILLTLDNSDESVNTYIKKAANLAWQYQELLRKIGITAYIEESGYRGFHVWILFSQWIQIRYLNAFQDIIESKIGEIDEALTVEYFPNKTKTRNGKLGHTVKLPYGFHVKTMKQSVFLEDDFTKVAEPGKYIMEMATYSAIAIKRIIGKFSKTEILDKNINSVVDEDLSEFGDFSDSIMIVLKKCNLMRYLCQKARKTGYLTHFERLSLLYVFGHMGDEGGEFIHKIMSFTLNYQYRITQKFVDRVPAKPISCLKLRDQYQKITAEYGCNCVFIKTKNCYPSPVLHAIKSGTDEDIKVTLPTSRSLSKEKEIKVCEEININKKVQSIASKILELKKQKRSIDKNIEKNEKELEKIFDDANVDCLEIEIGVLVRRKKENGYEWIVEI